MKTANSRRQKSGGNGDEFDQAQGRGEVLTDRLPPHAPAAEQGLLACVLLDDEVLDECAECGVADEWFFDLRHQHIFASMVALEHAGVPVDVITLQQHLADLHLLEQVGGLAYLAVLPDLVPSAANLPNYVAILREKWLLREVLKTATYAAAQVLSIEQGEKTEPEVVLERMEREVLRLSEERSRVAEVHIRQVVLEVQADLENYHRGRAQVRGLTTGLAYLDKMLCGLGQRNGNYVVLSGRPSTGKTSLAVQIAMHAAIDYVWFEPVMQERPGGGPPIPVMDGDNFKTTRRAGVPVGIFSLEMAKESLVERMLFMRAVADMQRWRTGFAESQDIPNLIAASVELAKAPIYIDDTGRLTMDTLRARARRMFRQRGIKLFVIDYVQLLRGSARRKREDRVQELAEISGDIQALGKELNVPFVVLAQMNRDFEKDPTRQPRLSDLKDCGSIEQDADVVGFLHSPKLNGDEKEKYNNAMTDNFKGGEWSKRPKRVNCLIAKNRYGPTGPTELLFQKSSTIFHDYNVWLKDHGAELGAVASGEGVASEESPPQQEELET